MLSPLGEWEFSESSLPLEGKVDFPIRPEEGRIGKDG